MFATAVFFKARFLANTSEAAPRTRKTTSATAVGNSGTGVPIEAETSVWLMGFEISPAAGLSASSLTNVNAECPAFRTLNVNVATLPLPLNATAGLCDTAAM